MLQRQTAPGLSTTNAPVVLSAAHDVRPPMKISRLPILALPIVALAAIGLAALFSSFIDQAYLRGAYVVWQENETFAAATIALLAALYASRPVYLQVRAQSVQAALDLLRRIEADTDACIDARKKLFELRRAAVTLAGEIHAYATAAAPAQELRTRLASVRFRRRTCWLTGTGDDRTAPTR